MRILVLLSLLLSTQASAALCSRVYNFTDGSILTASQLNTEYNAIINCVNGIDNANITTSAGISPIKISSTIDGDGITRNGTTGALSVSVDNSTIEISGDAIQVKDLGITYAKLAAALKLIINPPGMTFAFAGTVCPGQSIKADGSTLLRAGTYANLFIAIGTTWGTTDSTNFKIPNLIGRIIKGAGTITDGHGGDSVALGAFLDDQFQGHYHSKSESPHSHGISSYNMFIQDGTGYNASPGSGAFPSKIAATTGVVTDGANSNVAITGPIDGANGTVRVGDETRPKTYGLNYCIWY